MYNQYVYKSMGTVNRHMQHLGEKVSDVNNIFTNAYKAKSTTFHETMSGIKAVERRDLNDGTAKKTNRELDFAIDGKGYFEIELPDGTYAYTRDGSFTVSGDGRLMSSQGHPVVIHSPDLGFYARNYDEIAGQSGAFDVSIGSSQTNIPTGSSLIIDEEGLLRLQDSGQVIGKISVVNFTNPDGLRDIGDNLYIPTATSGAIEEAEIGSLNNQTKIKQGYIETSNVSVLNNMSNIVQINTAIKSEMKIIKMLDQMQENLTSTITRNL